MVSATRRRRAMGGSTTKSCKQPGVVAIVEDSLNYGLCTGVLTGPSTLLLAKGCSDFVSVRAGQTYASGGTTKTITFTVYAAGGAQSVKYKTSSDFKATANGDGTVHVTLSTPIKSTSTCHNMACSYNATSMTNRVNFKKCHLAGYGDTAYASFKYSGTLTSIPITTKMAEPYCSIFIKSKEFPTESDVTVTTDPSIKTTCLASKSGAACTGDQGGPIYCEADTGELILVGLVGGYSCEPGAVFAAIDLTGGVYASAA